MRFAVHEQRTMFLGLCGNKLKMKLYTMYSTTRVPLIEMQT
jgi:hypothetical protein